MPALAAAKCATDDLPEFGIDAEFAATARFGDEQ